MEAGRAWKLHLCGRVELRSSDGTIHPVFGAQPAALLGLLALSHRPVRASEIADLLWGEDRWPAHWQGAVRGVVAKLRAQLGRAGLEPSALASRQGLLTLDVPAGWSTDIELAITALDAAATHLAQSNAAEALAVSSAAREVLCRPLGIEGEGAWLAALTHQVTVAAQRARHLEIDALLAQGQAATAASHAADAVTVDPLDDHAHRQLVHAHLQAGNTPAARRAFAAMSDVLRDELGMAPDAELATLLATSVTAEADRRSTATGSPARAERPFVGRLAERMLIRRAWQQTVDTRRPHLVVIEGPAGIGKTHLARAVVAEAAGKGARWLWGRSRAGVKIPFDALRAAFEDAHADPTRDLHAWIAGHDTGVQRLTPSEHEPSPEPMLDDDRGAVLRDVTASIRAIAATPTVLVFDDFHWASGDTLALVTHLLDGVRAPLLVIVTIRTGAIPTTLASWLADSLRQFDATPIALPPLSPDEVTELIGDLTAGDPRSLGAPSATDALYARTAGHPYFVTEVLREARRTGSLDLSGTPDAVRTWVRWRRDALGAQTGAALDAAAILGPDLTLTRAVAMLGTEEAVVLADLEALHEAGFLDEGTSAGGFSFPHEIAREVVLDALGGTRRARLHRRAGDACAADGLVAAAALHYRHGGPEARAHAVRYLEVAAQQALRLGAWDLTVEHVDAVEPLAPVDSIELVRLLILRGRAFHALGCFDKAVADLRRAVDLAIEGRYAVELAEASCQLVGRSGRGAALGMSDVDRAAHLQRALDALETWPTPDGTHAERELWSVVVAGELGWARLFDGDVDSRIALLDRALDRTTHNPDASLHQRAVAELGRRSVQVLPSHIPERLAAAREVAAFPAGSLPTAVRVAALIYEQEDLLTLGRHAEARQVRTAAAELANRHGHPFWCWAAATWESLALLIDGDPDAAEAALTEAGLMRPYVAPEAVACHAVQTVAIRLHQGRAAEVVDLVAHTADATPHIPCYRAVEALCRAQAGDLDGARRAYAHFERAGFANIPLDPNRLLALACLTDVATDLRDEDGTRHLRALLAPAAELQVVLNCYGGGGAYWGSVADLLERCDELLGDGPHSGRYRAVHV